MLPEGEGVGKLRLLALTLTQLEALGAGAQAIDGLPIVPGALAPAFILVTAADALRAGKPPLWHSPWLCVADSPERAVGTAGFKGPPTSGRVELGYGIAASCRRQGFATAAVRCLVELVRRERAVTEVLAETAFANPASRRVVEKAGFALVGQRETVQDGWVDQWCLAVA
ncbi:MAG: GNAT family N-acetyltransferase [Casimicrobiaceae bacterium]